MSELSKEALAPVEKTREPPVCRRCGAEYTMVDHRTEPTPYCDGCAHEVCTDLAKEVEELSRGDHRRRVAELVGEAWIKDILRGRFVARDWVSDSSPRSRDRAAWEIWKQHRHEADFEGKT